MENEMNVFNGKTVKENLKNLRIQRGYSQQRLATFLSLTRQGYNHYETGKRIPDLETIRKLADFFGVSTDYILGNDSKVSKGAVRINVLGHIPAGTPIEAVQDILDWEEIPEKWTEGGIEFFALSVSGDSMFPKYIERDVIICRKQPDCDSGQDAIVFVNHSDATLKKVVKQESGLLLQPLNSKYDSQFYSKHDIETLPVTILGIVIEIRRKV